jgi:hypothetical protein
MASILASLKSLETAELFKVLKTAVAEAEKKAKSAAKGVKNEKSTKKGSMPKGVVPNQLKKPRAWVEFVLAHAKENGWEAFTVSQSKKDKTTGEKIEEIIEMPASIVHDGAHVYEGSVTEKLPNGKQIIQKDAMSLSKHYWAPKDKTGTRPELYAEFEEKYVEDASVASETSSVASTPSKTVVRMTAAEKEAEKERKKAEKEAEKEAKKAAKEEEKAAKAAEKEAEKEAKKAAKEAEKAAKAAEKEAAKAVKGKKPAATAAPAAAVKKAAASAALPTPVKMVSDRPPVRLTNRSIPPPPPKAAAAAWTCPADGMIHPWAYKGKNYFRNSDNEVWLKAADGSCGAWQGIYLASEDRIDDSVPEPEFAEED